MNGYERIKAALAGKETDKIPVMLHNFMQVAKEAGYSMAQYRENPKFIAEAFIKSVEKYQYDGVLVDIDTVTLAGACGVEVDFPNDEPARSHGGLLNSYDMLTALKPVNVGSYKYVQIWCEAVRLIKEHFGNEIYVRGNCDQAPFSLASMIRGTQNWMVDFYLTEEHLIFELLDYCTDATVQFVKLMAQTGCDMVSNGDSPAGPEMISPDLYERFAQPYTKKVVDVAHSLGVDYVLHICGNTEIILEHMIGTGADGLELDYKTNSQKAFDAMKDRTTFFGNIDPSGVLALGSPDLVKAKTIDLLDIFSKTNRFVLNSGCALPSITPEENIKMLINTAREYK